MATIDQVHYKLYGIIMASNTSNLTTTAPATKPIRKKLDRYLSDTWVNIDDNNSQYVSTGSMYIGNIHFVQPRNLDSFFAPLRFIHYKSSSTKTYSPVDDAGSTYYVDKDHVIVSDTDSDDD